MYKLKILIIDDNKFILNLYKKELEDQAVSGDAASLR